jgi:hypothetical protein
VVSEIGSDNYTFPGPSSTAILNNLLSLYRDGDDVYKGGAGAYLKDHSGSHYPTSVTVKYN